MKTPLTRSPIIRTAGLALVLSLNAPAFGQKMEDGIADKIWIDHSGTMIDAVLPFEFQDAILSISGPHGAKWKAQFPAGFSITTDLAQLVEGPLADGRYSFEVRFRTDGAGPESERSKSGHFTQTGFIDVANHQVQEISFPALGYSTTGGSAKNAAPGARVNASGSAGTQDVSDSGDLAIGGYGVFGSDNTSDIVAGKLRILEASDGGGASMEFVSETETDGSGDLTSWFVGNNQGDFGITNGKSVIFGMENDAPENSLVIDSQGEIGMGVANPLRQLHLSGENAVFRMDRPTDSAAFIIVRTDDDGTPLKAYTVGVNANEDSGQFVINDLGPSTGGAGERRMTITDEGDVDFPGEVSAQGVVLTSSARFKDNIRPIANAAEALVELDGVSFDWKDSGDPSLGLIAEDVLKTFPEVVAVDQDTGEARGVNYAALTAVLVEAFKSQQVRIEELERRLDQQ